MAARPERTGVVAGFVVAASLAGCATTPAPAPAREPAVAQARRLGDAMDEAGRRFRRASRAVQSNRWDLAAYDLHELDEIFDEDLANSQWHGKPELGRLAVQLRANQLTGLHAAVTAHDRVGFAAAVAATARACNDCHKQADVAYIEISTELGAEAPVIDTLPATASLALDRQ
jgi:hypothetical protein